MNQKIENEVGKAAQILGLTLEEVMEKWNTIVKDNSLNPDNDVEVNLGLSMFRQWFSGMKRTKENGNEMQTKAGSSLVKTGFGVVIAVEEARDFEEWNRNQLQAEYVRDRNMAFNAGKFAYADSLEDGGYKISQIYNNELKERSWDKELPDSVMEIEGRMIIPLDDRKQGWDGNESKTYGFPRALSNWRRTIHFIGESGDGNVKYWRIMAKDDNAQNWSINAQEFVSIDLIWSPEKDEAYPVQTTLETVVYNSELPTPKDTPNLSDLIAEHMKDKVSSLVNIENYHNSVANNPTKTRVVVTDGNVINMNMNPNVTGNRTLMISDINADFDYDAGGYASTTCWVPPHINIDFGLGSHVLVIGRTNQSRNQETQELRQCSINTFGVIVLEKRGAPVEYTDSGEQYEGWF
tara:strand:- start:2904 stop:4124 length:1221 start_codon:yes stop_codon:yes gene_type:complete